MVLSDIRKQARESLSGKWGKTALIILMQFILFFIMNFCINLFSLESTISLTIKLIVSIIVLIIEIPLSIGIVFAFVKLKREKDVGIFDFISLAMKNFGRAWKIYLRILLKNVLPIIGTMVTIILLSVTIVAESVENHSLGLASLIMAIVLLIVSFIVSLIIDLKYSLAYMIAYDNPKMTTKEAVNTSGTIMKGHKMELFLLQLSFLGWSVLCVLTLGIGFLWLLPYKQMAIVCFYDEVNVNKYAGWENY